MRGKKVVAVALSVLVACKGHSEEPSSTTETHAADDAGITTVESIDAGGAGKEARVIALDLITPVFNIAEWPAKDPSKTTEERAGAVRLGYLRRNASVAVKPKLIKKQNCPEGWYELATGGFVCGKMVTTDPDHKDLKGAANPPKAEGPLPYDYGLNLTNGAPLYRRRPLKKERKDLEKGLQVGKSKKKEDGDESSSSSSSSQQASASAAAAGGDPNAPWYLQDHHGQRPQVKVDDLKTNEQGGLVVVRMVRGFYLGVDKELHTPSGRFWRTTAGFLAPSDHILVHKPTTEFEGVKIGAPGEKRHLPLAWLISPKARKCRLDEEGGAITKVRRTDPIDRFTIVQLTGKKVVFEDRKYYETDEGWYVRDIDAAFARPGPLPKGIGPNEKWIDVNLSAQSLVAFEGEKPVYATIVSTGRHNDTDKSKDHRTVMGDFRIREKHIAATMEDDGASDGPYSIQDVPWIMYFEGSYALHGAFWHSSFGRERSHGCVNMTPHDAKWIFGWSGPQLPAGWHGTKATKENPGTRVIVHD